MRSQTCIFAFLAFLVLSISGCGGGSSGGSGSVSAGRVTISATVGLGYTIAQSPSFMDHVQDFFLGKRAMAISSSANVDKVIAIPSFSGSLSPADLQEMQIADVASDGSFSVSLSKTYDWVLLLVDSNAIMVTEQVAGYVAVTVEGDDTLVALAGSKLTSDLSLGNLTKIGDEAKSATSGATTAASFDFTLDELTALAKSDDGYKQLINLYINYNPATGKAYQIQPGFTWGAGSITSAGNLNPDSTTISSYQPDGFGIGIETANISEDIILDICAQRKAHELVPPVGSTINTVPNVHDPVRDTRSWTDTNTFSNDGDVRLNCSGCEEDIGVGSILSDWGDSTSGYGCHDADFNMTATPTINNSLLNFGYNDVPLDLPSTGMPSGTWIYKIDGVPVAWFDLDVASPVSAPGVFDTTPIPALVINHDVGTGEIHSLEVIWFQYDASLGQYVKLTAAQISAFDALVSNSGITVLDGDGTDPANNPQAVHLILPDDPEASSNGLHTGSGINVPSDTWYMPGYAATGKLVPTQISISLSMSGAGYTFNWYNPHPHTFPL